MILPDKNWTADLFVREELELPIPLGSKASIDRAHEVLNSISEGEFWLSLRGAICWDGYGKG